MNWREYLCQWLGLGPAELDRLQPGHTKWAAIFWRVVLLLAIVWLAGAIAERRAV